MKKLALVGLLAACVPTEPEKDPRGGVAVTFAPSEATAGTPFPSRDGWTVQIEKVAMRASATALPLNIGNGGYGGGGNPRLFDPRYTCEVRVTGLTPGPVAVTVQMLTFDPRWGAQLEESDVCAVDALTRQRFKTYSDDTLITPELLAQDGYTVGNTPSLYVKGSATKDGRVLRFDWALAVESASSPAGEYDDNGVWHPRASSDANIVDVEANQGAPAKFEVHVESLFARGIDELAAADANGDGIVAPDELRAVNLACQTTSYPSGSSSGGYTGDDDDGYAGPGYDGSSDGRSYCVTLLQQLLLQGAAVIGKTPTTR